MSAYFFDSSAFVKRFAREKGTAFVFSLLRPSNNHSIYFARFTEVEVCSALARRTKGNRLTSSQFRKALNRLRRDFAERFVIVSIDESTIRLALVLSEKHALRGYDAIQLATASKANEKRLQRGLSPLIIVSADSELNTAAQAEGLQVENPNNYP